MYQPTDPQRDMFDAGGLMPPTKQEACRKSWAGPFREHALPILLRAEPKFAKFYDEGNGRPNRSVALVLGTLILKEVNDLIDEEAISALRFDTRWWYAFDLAPEEADICQKTLHNFRVKLLLCEDGQLVFRLVTDELIKALGLKVDQQRLDSTHILSNFARLNRLALICETLRVFLHALWKRHRQLHERLPAGVLRRHEEESGYADARRGQGTRRLGVAARDVYRVVEQFENHRAVSQMEEYKLLVRLYQEQCEAAQPGEGPKEEDDDRDDGPAPVKLKEAKQVSSKSLQTPHDPGVSYSGHKGKGYSAQISETCVKENPVQMVTHVATTGAAESDAHATIPTIDALDKAGHKPKGLATDTTYSGAKNAAEAAKRGVNLLAPAPAKGKPEPGKKYPAPAAECPKNAREAGEWLKQQEAAADFKERYAIRAGIEGTNSEFKRAHGLGKLRVRGEKRVNLAVCLKATACNLKRALRHWLEPGLAVEGAAALA